MTNPTIQNHATHHTPTAEQAIATLVEQLLAAENDQKPKFLASLLSPRFAGITRADGHEQGREEYVNNLCTSRLAAARRRLEQPAEIHAAKTLAAARLVTVTTGADGATPIARSRDTLLFEHVGDGWRCLSWQSTRLT